MKQQRKTRPKPLRRNAEEPIRLPRVREERVRGCLHNAAVVPAAVDALLEGNEDEGWVA